MSAKYNELIIRIIHAVSTENSFQAAFIKGLVVRYQWQAFNAWSYFLPHNGKDRSIPGICQRQTHARGYSNKCNTPVRDG